MSRAVKLCAQEPKGVAICMGPVDFELHVQGSSGTYINMT